MANLPQQNTIVQYVADGITTVYIVPFYTPLEIDGTPDLDVFTQAANATPIPATDINEWNVAYTYTPNLDPTTGGIITFQLGYIPPNGYIVTIVRDVSASLDAEFANAQNFSGITLDAALDKLLLISQQNKSYTLERNLSYIVNSYLPESTISANVQIPVLAPGQVWFGSLSGVIAVTLEQSADTSTLRSELANNQPITNGAALVGYYDTVNLNPTNVAAQLTLLTNAAEAAVPTGTILDFAGTVAPSGFVMADGSSYTTASQPNLFAVIGYTWGGSGANFNVPNLNGKVTAGSGGTLPPLANTVGSIGGAATYQLTANDLAPHTHDFTYTYQFPAAVASGAVSGYAINAGSPGTQSNSGATAVNVTTNTPITLVQPTAIVLKIIKT
jgi:microcystin-dependent protein